MSQLEQAEVDWRLGMLGEVFRSSAPIDDQDLFAGRNHELFSVIEAMQSAGQHAVIYGERGVGKTSLARVAMKVAEAQSQPLTARVNCDGNDSYDSLWMKVLDEIEIRASEAPEEEQEWLHNALGECVALFAVGNLSPSTIRLGMRKFAQRKPVVLFFDEFNEKNARGALVVK